MTPDDIVISGLGLMSPFGAGLAPALVGLGQGVSCISTVSDRLSVGAVSAAVMPGKLSPSDLLVEVVEQATREAGVWPESLWVGTCSGEMAAFVDTVSDPKQAIDGADWYERATKRASLLWPTPPLLAETYTSACTSSFVALHQAILAVRAKRYRQALVAATDTATPFTMVGFFGLRVAGPKPSHPFAPDSPGLSFGEGAAAMIIERRELAQKRGANIIAQVVGSGLSSDAKHLTSPRADGRGLELAVRRALEGHSESFVDVCFTHGTGTPGNDNAEAQALRRMGFSGRPWLAHKGYWGHAMGASALMSLVVGLAQLRDGDDFLVPYSGAPAELTGSLNGCRTALALAAGFGGGNAAVTLEIES